MTDPRPQLNIHLPQNERETGVAARKAHERMRGIMAHSREGRWTAAFVVLAVLTPFVLLLLLGLL